MKKNERNHRASHFPLIGFLAILIAILPLVWTVSSRSSPPISQKMQEELTVEHTQPLTAHLIISTGKQGHIIEIQHENIYLTRFLLPSSWKLREARGASIESVQSNTQGAKLWWKIPPKAVLSFIVPTSTESLLVQHTSSALLQLKVTTINLDTGTQDDSSVLLREGTTEISL